VIPSTLAADPNSASLRWAMAHEWSHVLQGDFSVQLLASFTKFVCFYQPAYWWLRRQLTLSQDFLADAFAAKQGQSTEDYADFLVSIARKRNQPLLAGTLGISDRGSNLLRRVNMLVQSTQPLLQKNKLLPTLLITLLALLTVGGLSTVRLNARPTEDQSAETANASEEIAQSSLYLKVNAYHPGYLLGGESGYPHSKIRKELAKGISPFFSTIRLIPGKAIYPEPLIAE